MRRLDLSQWAPRQLHLLRQLSMQPHMHPLRRVGAIHWARTSGTFENVAGASAHDI
jgi:hypothetical protein